MSLLSQIANKGGAGAGAGGAEGGMGAGEGADKMGGGEGAGGKGMSGAEGAGKGGAEGAGKGGAEGAGKAGAEGADKAGKGEAADGASKADGGDAAGGDALTALTEAINKLIAALEGLKKQLGEGGAKGGAEAGGADAGGSKAGGAEDGASADAVNEPTSGRGSDIASDARAEKGECANVSSDEKSAAVSDLKESINGTNGGEAANSPVNDSGADSVDASAGAEH